MSTDSNQELSRDNKEKNHSESNNSSSPEISIEQKDDIQFKSPPNTDDKHSSSRSISPKAFRSPSRSSKPSSEHTNPVHIQRPPSPVTRHRTKPAPTNRSRPRSNSPRKTFSYLTGDRLNIRQWKQQRQVIAKQDEDDRIYYENRQKLERLAKIAKEPSCYPSIHIEQERLRERHETDHRRKVLKGYIPILKDNLCIVGRLANVKGVYDTRKMEADFTRHTGILKQDAVNRKKARETAAQRPFILPKINLKS